MLDFTQLIEDMEVVGSDGQHVGTFDKLAIKLAKKDPTAQGQHHILNIELVGSIEDGKLKLTIPAAQAIAMEKTLSS